MGAPRGIAASAARSGRAARGAPTRCRKMT